MSANLHRAPNLCNDRLGHTSATGVPADGCSYSQRAGKLLYNIRTGKLPRGGDSRSTAFAAYNSYKRGLSVILAKMTQKRMT